MKTKLKLLLAALALQVFCMGSAAIAATQPICPVYNLEFDIDKITPRVIDAYHGETLDIRIILTKESDWGDTASMWQWRFYWQEVGMGDDFWEKSIGDIGSRSDSGVGARVFFDSRMDTGAKVYNCFIGAPGQSYRAAFQIRMRPSPGAEPSILPLPVKTLDFAKVHVENAPYYTKAEINSILEDFEPSSGSGTGLTEEQAEKLGKIDGLETRVGAVETAASSADTKATEADTKATTAGAKADAAKAAAEAAQGVADAAKLTSDRVLAVMTANENVWFEATNYYGMAGIPASMQLYEKRDGATKLVWDQRNWVRWHVDSALEGKALELTDSLSKWSSFQSFSGEANPLEDTTWISTPRVALSGGFEWQKNVLSSANVFVLHSNGLAAISSPTEGSFFSVEDLDGSPLLTVKKTADQTLPAQASAVSTDQGTLIITYNVASASHPIVNVCLKLEESERVWYAEDDPLCPATVTWSGASGHWVCELTPKYVTNSLFAYAHYTKEGQTLIEMNGVAGASKGFVCSDDPSKIVKIIWNNGNPKFVEVQ